MFSLFLGTTTRYHIIVKTGDVRFAGTDANVFIQMSGPKGITKKLKLDDAKNNFERNMVDTFDVSLNFQTIYVFDMRTIYALAL